MITKTKPELTYGTFIDARGVDSYDLGFLAKAIGCNPFRPQIHYIYIEQDGEILRGIATDAMRMHIVRSLPTHLGLTPGYWAVLRALRGCIWLAKLESTEGLTFPDHKAILAGYTEAKCTTKIILSPMTSYSASNNNTAIAILHRTFPRGTIFNLDNIYDITHGIPAEDTWEVMYYGKNRAIVFAGHNRTAIIMPINSCYYPEGAE
jgi:hypothetical protein